MTIKCQHYWVIDNSNVGVCKLCDEERDFGKLQREQFAKEQGKNIKTGKRRGRPRKQLS